MSKVEWDIIDFVEFDLSEDKKKINIYEKVEYYASNYYSKDEFWNIIKKLQELHNQMIDDERIKNSEENN